MVPLEVEVAEGALAGRPNMAARSATTSFSMAPVAGPPSRAWLLGLTVIAAR